MSAETNIGIVSTLSAGAACAALGGPKSSADRARTLPDIIGFTVVIAGIMLCLVVPWAERRSQAPDTNRPAKAGLVSGILGLLMVGALAVSPGVGSIVLDNAV